MSKNTRNVLIGIVIGVMVLAAGQYVWSKYQANKGAKDFAVSMKAFQAATNKKAYFESFIKSQPKGLSLGLSNSSASEGDSSYCEEIAAYLVVIQDYIDNYELPVSIERDQNLYLAIRYREQARGYAVEAGCGYRDIYRLD